MIEVNEVFAGFYPGARVGFLAAEGLDNRASCSLLRSKRESLERDLREQFAAMERVDLRKHGALAVYDAYYRGFKKTYHVLLQLESIAKKGRHIPEISPIVETMFMAELRSFLLTAVHDADALSGQVTVDLGDGKETYQTLTGDAQAAKQNDMLVRDGEGITSSIIHGPDARTAVTEQTCRALYVVYAPEGIRSAEVQTHFEDILDSLRRFCPDFSIEQQIILPGEGP